MPDRAARSAERQSEERNMKNFSIFHVTPEESSPQLLL
jgi:hypothetical protein